MIKQVLFRHSIGEEEEYQAAIKHMDVCEYRSLIRSDVLVIPRYSSLPYYQELEYDVKQKNSRIINSYKQHKYIANFEYYDDIENFTFKTWPMSNISDIPDDIPLVIKGTTNSKKWSWNTHMYAYNKKHAITIASLLMKDSLIGQQDIIFRKYEPLTTFEIGINGLPFTNEYRFFFYKTQMLCHGYYWNIAEKIHKTPQEAIEFAQMIANIISRNTNFFVLDVAEKNNGSWVLVEVNCGTMSGLSSIDPNIFYHTLKSL